MLSAFARAIAGPRTKWAVLAVWIVLAGIFGTLGMKLGDRVDDQVATPSSLPADAPTAQIAQVLDERFPGGDTALTLVVYRREGGLAPADRERILADAAAAGEVDGAAPPIPPFGPRGSRELVSPDGAVAVTAVPLLGKRTEGRTEALDELRELTQPGAGGGLSVRVTGPAAIQSDISTALEAADAPLLIITGLLVLALLIALFRSPIVPFLPLFVVGVSVVIAQGLIYLYAGAVDVTVDRTALSLLAVLVFGAGTDYCLLLVSRYTVALRCTEDKHDAMVAAFPSAAPAIAASGITVAGALLTALAARLETNEILGPVNAIGILVVLAASLTLLPALLAIAGRRAFWPSRRAVELDRTAPAPKPLPGLGPLPEGIRRAGASTGVVGKREGFWSRLASAVVRRPVGSLAVSLLILGAFAAGLVSYGTEVDQIDEFRNDTDSTAGYELLRTGFPEGALVPMTVLVDSDEGPPDAAAGRLRRQIAAMDGVAAASEIQRRSTDGRAATFVVTFGDDPYGDAALDRVESIRGQLAGAPPGTRALAGDGTAARLDYKDAAAVDQRRIVPLVLGVIFLTLVVLLRALVAPVFLLLTVVASYFAALGLSVVAFDLLLGEAAVDPVYPLFSFIFLVALGVDYNIFLMSAVREEAAEHGTREGILRAIRSTGPVITSAGIILAGTFAVLTTLPLEILLQIGFTVAVGVLLDTFLVRTVTVPAIAWLLGEKCWWPSRPAGGAVGAASTPGPLLAARRDRG